MSLTHRSIIDLTDDHVDEASETPVLSVEMNLTTVDPGEVELRCGANNLFQGQDWQCDDNRSLGGSSASYLGGDSLFSCPIRSPSPSLSSNGLPELCSGNETTVRKKISNLEAALDVVDDNSNFETLFDQYIRSRSSSPPTSPGQDGTPSVSSGPRLRLLVGQPKITLHLKLQGPGQSGKEGMEKEPTKRATQINVSRQEREGKGNKNRKRRVDKKQRRSRP
jgi:hypothetical protein